MCKTFLFLFETTAVQIFREFISLQKAGHHSLMASERGKSLLGNLEIICELKSQKCSFLSWVCISCCHQGVVQVWSLGRVIVSHRTSLNSSVSFWKKLLQFSANRCRLWRSAALTQNLCISVGSKTQSEDAECDTPGLTVIIFHKKYEKSKKHVNTKAID